VWGEIFISGWDARLPESTDTLNRNVRSITWIFGNYELLKVEITDIHLDFTQEANIGQK